MGSYSSTKIINKKRKKKKLKVILFFLGLILLLFGFVYWVRNPNFNINKISIIKNNFAHAENIEASVQDSLKGKILFFIPKTNVLFVPKQETKRKIKQEFPEIENIDISLKSSKEIEVKISEYEPKVIWIVNEKRYFVNKEGNIFMAEPILHSYDELPVIEDLTREVKIGDNVIASDFLMKLLTFVENLKTLDLEIYKIRIPDQEVFYLSTMKGFEILVGKNDDLEAVFENIGTIIDDGALDKENLSLIDYIDLRFGNKVFYKLK